MIKKLFAGILIFSVLCSTYHVELFTQPRDQNIHSQNVPAPNQKQQAASEPQNMYYESLPVQTDADLESTEPAEGIPYGDFQYILREGNPQTAAICGYTGDSKSIVVPDAIDGIQVTEIADHTFENCYTLESISLPDGLETIGNSAFRMCIGLTEICIPEQVKKIGAYAFGYCRFLKVEMPSVMESIGRGAFTGCGDLAEIHLPRGITAIEDEAFNNCRKITAIDIPDGVVRIGNNAFGGCRNLVNITIPESISEIGTGSFSGCSRLTILGGLNTYAQSYAENNNINFRDIAESYLIGLIQTADRVNRSVTVAGQVYAVSDDFDFDALEQIMSSGDVDVICTVKDGIVKRAESMKEAVQLDLSIAIASKPAISFENGAYYEDCQDIEVAAEVNTTYPLSAFDNADEAGIYVDALTCETVDEGLFMSHDRNSRTGNKKIVEAMNQKLKPGAFFREIYVVYIEKDYLITEQEMPYTVMVYMETEHGKLSKSLEAYAYNYDLSGDQGTMLAKARRGLQSLCQNHALLDHNLESCLDSIQQNTLRRYLYTWMAQIDYAYSFSGDSKLREAMLSRLGVAPDADFSSGNIKAVTNVKVKTKYGVKIIAFALDLGRHTGQNDLAASFGDIEYRILEKDGIPEGDALEGKCRAVPYDLLKPFAESVMCTADETLGSVYKLNSRKDDIAACFAIDRTIADIAGIELGYYFDQMYIVNSYPTAPEVQTVTVDGPANISIYDFDGNLSCRIVDGVVEENPGNVWNNITGDKKTCSLRKSDCYIELEGTDTGTMTYEIYEGTYDGIFSRTMQFTDLALDKNKKYTGYLLKETFMDAKSYSLAVFNQTSDQISDRIIYPDQDTLQNSFQKIERLSIDQSATDLDAGHTLKLDAKIFPENATNKNLYWVSDNPSAAEVDGSGLVTAVGAGSAVITAVSMDGSFLKASCVIKVQKTVTDQNPGDTGGSGSGSTGGGDSSGTGGSGSGSTGGGDSSGTGGSGSGSTGGGNSSGTGSSGGSGGTGGSSGTDNNPDFDDQLEVTFMYYIIDFDANGGTELSRRTMTLLKDDHLGILPKVRRENYVFDGWYTQKSGGVKVDSHFVPNAGASLYAQWKEAEPGRAEILVLKSSKEGKVSVSLKGAGASGYEISYSLKKTFPAASTKKAVTSGEKKTITGLKTGRKYYVRVRAYQIDSAGRKVYGAYSEVKSIVIK